MILGAGIYSLIGKAAGQAGESLWIAFMLAALAALLTAFSYAELGTMFPKAGAEYIYIKKSFPRIRWVAITIGLLIAFSGAATSATVALAYSSYISEYFGCKTIKFSKCCFYVNRSFGPVYFYLHRVAEF